MRLAATPVQFPRGQRLLAREPLGIHAVCGLECRAKGYIDAVELDVDELSARADALQLQIAVLADEVLVVQMPKGIPVATFAIGEAGAANAALFAVSLLANNNADLAEKLKQYRESMKEQVTAMQLPEIL